MGITLIGNYMKKLLRLTQALGAWLTVGALGIIPLFFLPLTQDFYDTPKWFSLVSLALVLTIVWALRTLVTRTLTVSRSPAAIGMVAMALASLLSLTFSSTNRIEAILTPYGAGTWISLALLLVFGETFLSPKSRTMLQTLLVTSASLLGIIAIYQFFGLGKAIVPTLSFLADPHFTPAGSSIGLATVLALVLPLALDLTHQSHRHQNDVAFSLGVVASALILGSLITTLWQLVPTLPTLLLPLSHGWVITLEALKTAKHLLVGVGAENFLSAFTAGRPVALNNTLLWNVRFTANSSLALHLITTYGLAGIAGIAVLFRALLVPFRLSPIGLGKLLAIAVLLFVQPQLVALILIAAILLIDNGEQTNVVSFHLNQNHKHHHLWTILCWVLGLVCIAGSGVAFYLVGRAYGAELSFYQAFKAAQRGEGKPTYELQVVAIRRNPFIARFHIGASTTSLALAQALAKPAQATPSAISSADRQIVTQLAQQAIGEAKIAVNLTPSSVLAWEQLASTYQSLTLVAQGSLQWAIATTQKTIQLDPTNPILRLRLGGIYVGAGDFDRAKEQFQAATTLKSDYANAHYNLAYVLRQKKDYLTAAKELMITDRLVNPGTEDASRVAAELDEVKRLLTEEEKRTLGNEINQSSSPPSGAQLQKSTNGEPTNLLIY